MQYKVSQRNWPRLRCAVEVAINSRPSSVMGYANERCVVYSDSSLGLTNITGEPVPGTIDC